MGNQQFGRTSFALSTLVGVAREISIDEFVVGFPTDDIFTEQLAGFPEVGEKRLDVIRRVAQTMHEKYFSGPERC